MLSKGRLINWRNSPNSYGMRRCIFLGCGLDCQTCRLSHDTGHILPDTGFGSLGLLLVRIGRVPAKKDPNLWKLKLRLLFFSSLISPPSEAPLNLKVSLWKSPLCSLCFGHITNPHYEASITTLSVHSEADYVYRRFEYRLEVGRIANRFPSSRCASTIQVVNRASEILGNHR